MGTTTVDPRHVYVPAPPRPAPTEELPIWVPVGLGHGYLTTPGRPARPATRVPRRRPTVLTLTARTAFAAIVMWLGVALGPMASGEADPVAGWLWWTALGVVVVGVPTVFGLLVAIERAEARR